MRPLGRFIKYVIVKMLSDTESINTEDREALLLQLTSTDPREVIRAWETLYGILPRRWPALVGDIPQRASAVVTYGTPYYVDIRDYKESMIHKRPYAGPYDPLRVVLFLDRDGYVAISPKTG